MKTQRLYSYLTVAALISIWSCTSSRQTAQNAGDVDDLYGNAGSSPVYASNRQSDSYSGQTSNRPQRFDRQQRANRNANPDFNDEQQGSNQNTDEYYTELSARKLNRGLSADPGWNEDSYNSGFVNGYNSASTSAYSWNRWGYNNTGFNTGLGLGLGMSAFGGYGYPSYRFGFGSPFYSPFGYGSSFAYSPYGYGSFYDPFYSSYAYGWGGYNSFYSPFGYGGYGGYYGSPVYANNVYVTGADPYRNRSYNRTYERSAGRYTSGFDNSTRTYNPNGGRASATTSGATGSRGDGYYARPNGGSSRGNYYYDNSSTSNGRVSSGATAPSYNSNSGNSEYYARPRESSRGSYSPSGGTSGGRSSYQPSQQSYSQPSYSQPSRGDYQQSQPSFSQPSQPSRSFSQPSYSAPSSGGGGGGFSGGGGHSSGGGRGPR